MFLSVRLFVLAIFVAVGAGPASSSSRDSVNAQAIRELSGRNANAESCFVAAIAAEERGDPQTAASLYHRVGTLVPGHVVSMRREGGALVMMGQRLKGLALIQSATARLRNVDNLHALASALIWYPNGPGPSPEELEFAAGHARAALEMEPTDPAVGFLVCRIAFDRRDLEDLSRGVSALERSAPDSTMTHFYAFVAHNAAGRRKEAVHSLERAHALGLSDEDYELLRRNIQGAGRHALLVASAWGGGVWLGLFGLLLVAGLALSAATLQRAQRVPETVDGEVRGGDGLVRRLYALVLWVSCAFYYVSLPVVILLVLAAAGGLIYATFAIGHVPIKLVLLVAVLALVTVWVTVRSAFVRVRDADPGERLDLEREPRLRDLLDHVAGRIGTRPVQRVFITPGAEVAVYERGGMLAQLKGDAERCMVLGAAAVDGMTLGPFRAVLAHEYGHFSNRDTAGGGFALAVRRSLMTMAMGLATSGAAAWYNPAWLFVTGFYRVFMRISQGASRLQEVLADRWAALAYGAAAFESGLRQVIVADVRFNHHVGATLKEVIEKKQALANLYRYQPEASATEADITAAIDEAMKAEPSVYDSHPAPMDRIAWVHRLATPNAEYSADDDRPVWSLFEDRDLLERRMTEEVRRRVQENHGVDIAGEEPAAAPAPT